MSLDSITPLERISTGIAALDEILQGGVPKYSITFIAGAPGSGKTVLCQQALFANANVSHKVLYLGTLSEPVIKMVRYVQGFTFYQAGIVGNIVQYGDLGAALARDGGSGVLEEIEELVKVHNPEFVVIDSFNAIRERFDDPAAFRDFMIELAARLVAWEVTSFFVGEYMQHEIASNAEFGIVDGIIYLYGTEETSKQRRFLRVMKMRGTDFFGGEHYFEITGSGMQVYPRMDPNVVGEYREPSGRYASKVGGLTEMLNGGIEDSTAALVVGTPGSGKTLLALSFMAECAEQGKPGLYVSFEESADQILRNCAAFGWKLDDFVEQKLLDIYHVSPSELDIYRHAYLIRQRAEAIKAKCIVMDTATALESSLLSKERYQSYMWAILDYFKRVGVTVIMTYESIDDNWLTVAGTKNISFMSDVIINLRQVNDDGILRRTVNVLKMRGNPHDRAVRELIIGAPEFSVGDVFRKM